MRFLFIWIVIMAIFINAQAIINQSNFNIAKCNKKILN